MNDAELIDKLGGPSKVAQLLGLERHGAQRVFNWKTRGIPPRVKLQRPDLFLDGAVVPPQQSMQDAAKAA